jgi:hypothetical protein
MKWYARIEYEAHGGLQGDRTLENRDARIAGDDLTRLTDGGMIRNGRRY